MSYTIDDVRRTIVAFKAPDQADFFRLSLLNNESVRFGDLGWAYYVQEEERDDYFDEGDLYFVFRIEVSDSIRYFKIEGWLSSYSGSSYHLHSLREVQPAKQLRYTWVNV